MTINTAAARQYQRIWSYFPGDAKPIRAEVSRGGRDTIVQWINQHDQHYYSYHSNAEALAVLKIAHIPATDAVTSETITF